MGGDAGRAGASATHVVPDPGEARRELLDMAVTAAGIGTFDWDLLTGRLDWDERLLELVGITEAGFGHTIEAFSALVHPEDVARVRDTLDRAVADRGDFTTEYRVVLPDGEVRWLAARGRALGDQSGRPVRILGAAWDITLRRQGQERVAGIVEAMAVGFLAVDGGWVVTHANAEAARITGMAAGDLVGRTLWELFPAAGTEVETAYRAAMGSGGTTTFEAHHPGPRDIWVEVRAVPSPSGLSLYFLDITARRRLQEQSEQAARRERLLSRITEDLGGTLDADEAVARLTRLVVPAVADWCIVTLVDDDRAAGSLRGLRNAASWHTDPALRGVADAYAQTRLSALEDDAIIVRALRTGRTQLLASGAAEKGQAMLAAGPVRGLLGRLAPEAVAVLPLPGRTGPVGMLTLANGGARGTFSTDDLVTARHVAARAGLVLDNARLYRQQRGLAEGFQRSLLTPPPEPDHMQVVVRYVPAAQAAEVGGDWYDAFFQPGGATVLVIGDVVGHDTRAAAAMGQIRSIVRTLAARADDGPASVLQSTERVMQTLQSGILATSVVARLEQSPDEREQGLTRLRWSNAGHPPPLTVAPDGEVRVLTARRTDLLLGVDPDTVRGESEVLLERDAVVLLYTDGLVERRDQDLDRGLDRLRRVVGELAGQDLDTFCDQVLARMLPGALDDDVALVAVRLHPQDRPRPPEAGPNRVPPNVPPEPPTG